MIREGLDRAEADPPKNESVVRALSPFSEETETQALVAAVTKKMDIIESCEEDTQDEDLLKGIAEPLILDLIANWGNEAGGQEIKTELEGLFKNSSATLIW